MKRTMQKWLGLGMLPGVVLSAGLGGCKSNAEGGDAQLTSTIQTQIAADTALAGQPVSVSVQGGVATLNGTMSNDAQKALAARDAAGVAGIKEVHNFLTVGPMGGQLGSPATATVTAPAPLPEPLKPSAGIASVESKRERDRLHEAAPIERSRSNSQQQYGANQLPQQPEQREPAVSPAGSAYRTVTVPLGDDLPVRVTQTLDSETTQQGDTFSGVVASDILVDGLVAIPAGSPVSGQVVEAHDAGHFRGSSSLVVALNGLTARGSRISVTSDPYSVRGKGRGVNTVEKAGGGAAVGAILGGIFGGGKGAAIGAAAGGGLGAGSNAITRGQQVQIPSETVVRFHLASPVTVRVRTDGRGGRDGGGDPNLQHRPSF